jgi:dipeptidyl aminopeptidase/acylaminoacyl peptidase
MSHFIRLWAVYWSVILWCNVGSGILPCAAQAWPQVLRDDLQYLWSEDGRWLGYSVDVAQDKRDYFKIELATGEKVPLSDVHKLSEIFSVDRGLKQVEPTLELGKIVTRSNRSAVGGNETLLTIGNQLETSISCYWLSADGTSIHYHTIATGKSIEQPTFENHVWSLRNSSGQELVRFAIPERGLHLQLTAEMVSQALDLSDRNKPSSKGSRRKVYTDSGVSAWIEDDNVWIETPSEPARQLSTDGNSLNAYQGPLYIAPSGRFLAVKQVRKAERRLVSLVESTPEEGLQPVIHQFEYTKPGDDIDQPALKVFDLQDGRLMRLSEELTSNAWNITQLQWLAAPERFVCLFNQRGHQLVRIVALDPHSGSTQVIVEETSETFIDYAYKTFQHWVNHGDELLWMSERSGFNHLYRFDGHNGDLLNAVTSGQWVVRGVEYVDEQSEEVYFSASGLDVGHDPYHLHLCRVDFDGSNFVRLTEGDGDHSWEFSPDRRWLIDQYSRVDLAPITVLRDARDGRLVCELEIGDWSDLLASGWTVPQRWVAKGRDGATDIYGIVVLPAHVSEAHSFPVVEKIYAGPHGAHVPKSFGLLPQEHRLAEQGFIVVRIDGMGTSHRGKAFHDVSWKNLADAGFPDRIAWMRSVATRIPQMDLSRVGIFGGSAGGQSAMRALIDHHYFYDVAVADCGCHDNRMDKIWWNEAWMGWPVDESYSRSSNVDHAHRLQGKLLLIVGELDRNVDPASTMQVVRALVDADKDFDLLVLPGVGHGAAETPYGSRRREQFLIEHLSNGYLPPNIKK